jgi:NTE family protein
MERRSDSLGVVLVLGAGGAAGHAFHAGVLYALVEACGWDARDADLIVGTSAGAQVAALLRAGVSPKELYAQVRRHPRLVTGVTGNRIRTPRLRWPASAAYLWRALRRPLAARPAALAAALLPESDHANAPLIETYARLLDDGWPERGLWITAQSLDTGERVVFGRADAPATDVANAVLCSSSVPALVRPGRVGGTRFVDGGIASPTNLDALLDAGVPRPRLVLVLSPLSAYLPLRWLLRRELRHFEGVAPTVAFEPGVEVKTAMGFRPLDAVNAPRVAEAALDECVRALDSGFEPLRTVLRGPEPPASRVTMPTTDAASPNGP